MHDNQLKICVLLIDEFCIQSVLIVLIFQELKKLLVSIINIILTPSLDFLSLKKFIRVLSKKLNFR